MGRKLNFFEANVFAANDKRSPVRDASQSGHRREEIQVRIAQALGIPVEALSQPADPAESLQARADPAGTVPRAMAPDCSALLQAFTSIEDPAERQRLLAIVQEAARKR